MIHYLKTGILTHCLDLAGYLSYKALFDEFICKGRVKGNSHTALGKGEEAVFLLCFDKQVFFCKCYLSRGDGHFKEACAFQFSHSLVAVKLGKIISYLAQIFSELRSESFQLRLELIINKVGNIIGKLNVFYVELISDYIRVVAVKHMVS